MEEIVDEEYTHFDSILKARLDSLPPKSRLFTYFYATITNKETGESWCGDCNLAWAHIDREVKKLMPAAAVALGFPVGERTEYREKYGAVHPYKIHSSIQLKKIPTLIEWETTTGSSSLVVKKQLVEGQCYNQECLNEFFNS